MKDGDEISEFVEYPKGEPENPISRSELNEKFYSLLRSAYKSDEEIKQLMDAVDNIEDRFEDMLQLI